MELTRLDTHKLADSLGKAEQKIDEALQIVDEVLFILTEKERESLVRPPSGFDAAGRQLADAAKSYPKLAQAIDYDGAAVVEDLDNVRLLHPLESKLDKLKQMLADARLTWNAEAYQPSLQLYGLAKVAARTDGALRAVIDTMAAIFPGRRARKAPTAPLGDPGTSKP